MAIPFTAMIDSGNGARQMNTILSDMAVPPPSYDMYRSRLDEVGGAIEKIAQKACEEARTEERARILRVRGEEDVGQIVYIRPAIDYQWQNPHGHKSLTGMIIIIFRQKLNLNPFIEPKY